MKTLVAILASVLSLSTVAQAADTIATTEVICSGKVASGIKSDVVTIIIQNIFPSGQRNIKVAVNGQVQKDEQAVRTMNIGAWGVQNILYTGDTVKLSLNKSETSDNYGLSVDGESIRTSLTCDKFVQIGK